MYTSQLLVQPVIDRELPCMRVDFISPPPSDACTQANAPPLLIHPTARPVLSSNSPRVLEGSVSSRVSGARGEVEEARGGELPALTRRGGGEDVGLVLFEGERRRVIHDDGRQEVLTL